MKSLKFIFSSLFSNEKIINESKKQPWWLAIVLILFSCIIALIPNFVSVMTVQGSNVITSNTNSGIDYSLKQFSVEYLSKEENKLYVENEKLILANTASKTSIDDYYLLDEVKHNETISLAVYYVDFTEQESAQYKTFNEKLSKVITKIKASRPITDTTESNLYSSLILGKETVFLMLCNKDAKCSYKANADGSFTISNETGILNNMSGNYVGINKDVADLNSYYSGNTESEKVNNAYNQWKAFFDKAYESPRNSLAWKYVGIYFGMDIATALVMGLMLFLLSKTKASLIKYRFLEALKMVFFAAVSPALIALILGFMVPSFQSMAFLMCYILRITWLGMKATNPPSAQAVRK